MKCIFALSITMYLSFAYAEKLEPVSGKTVQLEFFLNNFSLLLERNNPNEFPAVLRLVELPDQADDCSWLFETQDITTSFRETACPLKKLYLTLSNWDIEPDRYAYMIGTGMSWKIRKLVVHRRAAQSDWDASLSLEVVKLVEGKVLVDAIRVYIRNKHDVYSIERIRDSWH